MAAAVRGKRDAAASAPGDESALPADRHVTGEAERDRRQDGRETRQ
jgi:hypothetical protein